MSFFHIEIEFNVSLVDSDHDDNYVNFYKKSKGDN